MKKPLSIAICGVGGIFPGAPDLRAYWKNIAGRVDCAREAPAGRWALDADEIFDPEVAKADHVYSKRACFVEDTPGKSGMGLAIAPDTLAQLDPVYHLLLHAGHQAFGAAKTAALDRSRVGVVVGNLALPTEKSSALAREIIGRTLEEKILGKSADAGATSVHHLNRYVTGLPAAVLAKALGLGGEVVALDAACASSLYALKIAIDELTAGRADAMLAGGVARPDSLYTQMGFSQLRALSPTGTCSPFDENGNGLVVGEGAGIFVLKRLDDAIAQGDRIHGVIRGVGLSNDVDGGLLAPNSDGQLRAMRAAYRQAGWSPQDVDLIECHATGTPLGDATEVASLRNLWGGDSWEAGQCVIGSVKSNVGHLLTAAGAAAMTKVLLAFDEATLPPTANFSRPTPTMGLEGSPFRVLTEARPWRRRSDDQPRRAAVSAFGFGGINAHVLVEEYMAGSPVSKPAQPIEVADEIKAERIAVVGMDAYFGAWKSLREFQERVLGGGVAHEPTTPDGWWGAQDAAWFKRQGLSADTFRGHRIGQLDVPTNRFRIPPKEMEDMLPQQLLMLCVAANALEDAGLSRDTANDAHLNAGVYIGLGLDLNTTNFTVRWTLAERARQWAKQLGLHLNDAELDEWIDALRDTVSPALTANRTMGALGSIAASRIAREFRFGGPSFALSTEETSGLSAVALATRALQQGELDMALVGAVDFAGDVRAALASHHGRPYGDGAPFAQESSGAAIGEGAAAVVLKRESDALRDGDRVYALIGGVGLSAGGGVEREVATAEAYTLAARRALDEANVTGGDVHYVEAHGSGNPEEDAVEAAALTATFAGDDSAPVAVLGASKGALGHAGAASGLATFVKAALAIYHETLPPLGIDGALRAEFEAPGNRLRPLRGPAYWLRDREAGPQRALVASMGVGGTCAHMVLEACESDEPQTRHDELLQPLGARREGLFVCEANNVPALSVATERLRAHVEHHPDAPVERLARTWWRDNREDLGRSYALAFVARTGHELLDQIDFAQRWLADHPDKPLSGGRDATTPPFVRERVFYNPEPVGKKGHVAFVFPGSGNHYLGMGRELGVQWPEIYRRQDRENGRLRSQVQPDLFWFGSDIQAINTNHKAALFGQVALGTVVSDLIQSFGVQPTAVIGYSLGETAGLFALKAWTERDAMLDRINASTLFTDDLAGACNAARKAWKLPSTKHVDWALGVIDRPAKVVRAAMQDHKKVYSLIVNTLHECVVGGDRHAVEKLVKKLDCEFFPLQGVTTVHCEVAKEVQEPYRNLHVLPTTPPKGVRFYSGAWGTAYNVSKETAADAVLAQAIYGIDYPKVIESAYEDGARVFIEMGPGASCSRMIGEILAGRPHMARSACYQSDDAVSSVLRVLGQLLAERVPVDLRVLYGQDTAVVGHHEPKPLERFITVPVGHGPMRPVLPGSRRAAQPAVVETPAPQPTPPATPQPSIPTPTPQRELATVAAAPQPVYDDGATTIAYRETGDAYGDAHAAYLEFADTSSTAYAEALAFQMCVIEAAMNGGATLESPSIEAPPPVPAVPVASPPTPRADVVLDREQCMEFAVGSIAKVLGEAFAEVDTYPTRVRLPDEPLMLVDRITALEGEARSLTHGRVVTEHDILPGAWYLDAGRIPTCIAVEAGQADLFLSGYLGIDFKAKGNAVYRLLDAVVTFHRGLPGPGETIRYDIRIERFFRQGETYLFRFNFDATVNGEPLLTMRDGCAGFFTEEELASGKGVVQTALDTRAMPGVRPDDWRELVPMTKEAYSDDQLVALRKGNLAACFGGAFANVSLHQPAGLPGGRMQLVDRILDLDPVGGQFGMGQIRGEMDVYPDDWFITCHFVDDRVMPGTLMYECCMHTFRVFLMRMGWVGEQDEFVCEPVAGLGSQLKCRGQVTEHTGKVIYQVTLREVGYNPHPYAIANALMFADGKPVVEITNMSIQLTGLRRDRLEALWAGQSAAPAPQAALFTHEDILAYAEGNPSECFGEPYRVFDGERVLARLPRAPYLFVDEVTAATIAPWKLEPGGVVEGHYAVPPDAWYFGANRCGLMPFSILLEIALQPCGFFAAYMGSALTSDQDLHFRNLGGKATQHATVTPATGTLYTRTTCTNISRSGGMIIQHFNMEVRSDAGLVYTGDTYFGFFTDQALANQVGIREATPYAATDTERAARDGFAYPREAPYPDDMLRMVDAITVFDPTGGQANLGVAQAQIDVNPDAWFFQAHFYQDPVWPGSLGLEGMVQLLKLAAYERWDVAPGEAVQALAVERPHAWTYRGQVLPTDKRVTVDTVITAVDDDSRILTGEGYLTVDGRIIYHMKDFSVQIVRA